MVAFMFEVSGPVPMPADFVLVLCDSDLFAGGGSGGCASDRCVSDGSGYARLGDVVDEVDVYELAPDRGGHPCFGFRPAGTLFEYLGAVYKRCLLWDVFVWVLLYWPAADQGDPPQVSAVRAFDIWAGFMSEGRGLSWDRKSRYGVK